MLNPKGEDRGLSVGSEDGTSKPTNSESDNVGEDVSGYAAVELIYGVPLLDPVARAC